MSTGAVIFIIDSDAQRGTARREHLTGKSWECALYPSVHEFLDEHHGNQRGCVIYTVDPDHTTDQQVVLKDMGLVATLHKRNDDLPVIMLIDESQAFGIPQVIRNGVFDCLAHNVPSKELREVISLAIDEYDHRNQARAIMLQLDQEMEHMTQQQRLLVGWLRANLTPREIAMLMRRGSFTRSAAHGSNGKSNGHDHTNGNGVKPLEIQRWLGFAVEQIDSLSPRVRQTLEMLLTGFSEKQIAAKLSISRHTVHGYVKTLHSKLDVSSRGELLAKCLGTYQSEMQLDETSLA